MLASGGLEDLFWAFWKKKIYHEALAIYYRADRPYWLAYLVGRYFERKGQTQEAMSEFEHLVSEYQRMGVMPFPTGPGLLFKLAKWHVDKDKIKSVKYLKFYFFTKQKSDSKPAFYLRHKNAVKKILNRLKGQGHL